MISIHKHSGIIHETNFVSLTKLHDADIHGAMLLLHIFHQNVFLSEHRKRLDANQEKASPSTSCIDE